ncbi:MAG: RdgB/HAM1 family non-canonical purine NTP pyrophosphatase [Planctomycetota bacterium]
MKHVIDLATTNRHKAGEIAALLAPFGVEVRVPDALPDVEETGETFAENAALKARSAAASLGRPALAEDSGLVVPALGGEPGVRSARYAGPGATDADNNALLVERLTALGLEDPPAAFVCLAVVAAPDGRILAQAEGRVEGVIRWPARGGGGFGYDPLFHHPPSGMRLSELSAEAKNEVSHRGRALRSLGARLHALTGRDAAAGEAESHS